MSEGSAAAHSQKEGKNNKIILGKPKPVHGEDGFQRQMKNSWNTRHLRIFYLQKIIAGAFHLLSTLIQQTHKWEAAHSWVLGKRGRWNNIHLNSALVWSCTTCCTSWEHPAASTAEKVLEMYLSQMSSIRISFISHNDKSTLAQKWLLVLPADI